MTDATIFRRAVFMRMRPIVGRRTWRVHMDITAPDKLAEIRRLNDQFRTSFRGGQILLTHGVASLPTEVVAAALVQVASFKDFNEENDPHQEHDYLSFDLCNREFVFIIQYYNLEMTAASVDPANARITKRIATLMMTYEW